MKNNHSTDPHLHKNVCAYGVEYDDLRAIFELGWLKADVIFYDRSQLAILEDDVQAFICQPFI